MLPPWLKTWWQIFGGELTPCICVVRYRGEILGIAPLYVQGEEACLMGSGDVCDYLDCTVASGRGSECFRALFGFLREEGVVSLDLGPVRSDSTVLADLLPVAKQLGYEVSCEQEGVTVERDLPATWNEFLRTLSGKERHEIRRKLRRLQAAGPLTSRVIEDPDEVVRGMETFLALFSRNRADKAAFMTERMASFFCALARATAEAGLLRLSILELDGVPAATVLCFDYRSTVYLYNNGYDEQFSSLSMGLLSKVMTIRDSIHRRRGKYEFLKGEEPYKSQLGGRPVPLYRCRVRLRG